MLGASDAALLPPSAAGLRRNFLKMAVFFAINHGCVVSVLSLAVLLLGDQGAYQSGTLYVSYAVSALLFSTPVIAAFGSRKALIISAACYCCYVASVPLALIMQTEAGLSTVAILGGFIGGTAAGFLWAAQGAYFAVNSSLWATAAGVTATEANASFAALFGAVFLGLELVLKLIPLGFGYIPTSSGTLNDINLHVGPNCTGVAPDAASTPECKRLPLANLLIAAFYAVFAIGAVFGLLTIDDVETLKRQQTEGAAAPLDSSSSSSSPAKQRRAGLSLEKVTAAVALWFREPVVLLLSPIQVAFGLAASLLGVFVSGSAVPHVFPKGGSVNPVVVSGLLSALVSFLAGALQLPFKLLAGRFSRTPLMLAGLSAYTTLGAVCLGLGLDSFSLGALVGCFVLQGIGRACYEGTNKALYVDTFPNDAPAAFANLIVANGGASAIAYFTFPELSQSAMAGATLIAGLWAIYAYSVADIYNRRHARVASVGATA